MSLSRRDFLRAGALGLVACYLGGPVRALGAALKSAARYVAGHPWREVEGTFAGTAFLGDEHRRPHDILWHLEEYISRKGGRPAEVSESAEVIIVGGGTAGLLSAYELRDRNFILLEQASQFGGNARSEEYRGTAYSLGPAYVTVPEGGSEIDKFFRETGLGSQARLEKPEESRVLAGGLKALVNDPGDVGLSARALHQKLSALSDRLPPVPPASPEEEAATGELDALSAEAWLKAEGPWHPLVMEQLQLYAWSSFGGSLEEISAAQFLNFVAAETKGVLAFPGGNGAITRHLFEALAALPGNRLRAGTIVLEVKEVDGGVEVLAETAEGALQRLRGKSVVMAAPKYAARFLLKNVLSSERDTLWRDLPYRAYAVANVLLRDPAPAPAFDLYCLRGSVPAAPTFGKRTDRPVTDLVCANWAAGRAAPAVLTLYRPFPLEGARNILLGPQLHERLQKEFSADLSRWLGELGLGANPVEGIRVALWGHSLPLARPGFLNPVVRAHLSGPVGTRIFLANQDNYMSPAFESCFAAAQAAAKEVLKLLG